MFIVEQLSVEYLSGAEYFRFKQSARIT